MLSSRGARNTVQRVIGGAHKQDFGQIQTQIQVMVQKLVFCSGPRVSSKADAGRPGGCYPACRFHPA